MKVLQTLNKINKFKSFNFLNRRFFSKVDTVKFKYIYLADNSEVEVEAKKGENLLDIAKNNDVDLEGACEASLACSTCHIVLEEHLYKELQEPEEEEEDLLDTAFGLKPTSRLGCQVLVDDKFEGAKVFVPTATRNMYVDAKKKTS